LVRFFGGKEMNEALPLYYMDSRLRGNEDMFMTLVTLNPQSIKLRP